MHHLEEQFSALVDDAAELAPDHLVAILLDDEAARRRWTRHHLIGDVLRSRDTPVDLGLAARIREAIDAEPALLVPAARAPRAARPTPVRRAWAAAAVFAAVGFGAMLFALRGPGPSSGGALPVATLTPEVAQVPTARPAQPTAADTQVVRWDDSGVPTAHDPQRRAFAQRRGEFQRRLNSYLVNFNEQRSNLGMPGVHPYVRIVGFEGEDAP